MAEDEADAALDALIQALERSAAQRAAAAERGRDMARLRTLGYAWRDILSTEQRPLLSDTLFRELALMAEVIGHLRRKEAVALRSEGATTEEIAELFGLSVDHIEVMLGD